MKQSEIIGLVAALALAETGAAFAKMPWWAHLGIASICGLIAIYFFLRIGKKGPIQIFLPQWTKEKDGDFYQDGVIQKDGFHHAEIERKKIHGALEVKYTAIFEDDSANKILGDMKKGYESGSQYFVSV